MALGLPRPALAQTASNVLADVDRFRAAMPALAANVVLRRGQRAPVHVRLVRTAAGVDIVAPDSEAASWTASAPVGDMSARLLAAFCASGPLAVAVGALGYALPHETLGMDVLDTERGPTLAQRVGDSLCALIVEAGIARPRVLRIGRDETAWTVAATRYAELTQGWFPERIEIYRGDELEATMVVLDAARRASELAPLPTTERLAPSRMPWLPL